MSSGKSFGTEIPETEASNFYVSVKSILIQTDFGLESVSSERFKLPHMSEFSINERIIQFE